MTYVKQAYVFPLLAVLLYAGTARAQPRTGNFKNEFSGGMGFAVGLSNWAGGGFVMEHEYGRKFSERVWLNLQLNFVLGGGDYCGYNARGEWVCHGNYRFSGDAIQMIGGVKFKFLSGKLQPHAKVGGGLVFSFWGGDTSAITLAVRGGGGVKYWVIPRLAVGGEGNVTLGPAFVHDYGTEFYAAIDFIGGVEFVF